MKTRIVISLFLLVISRFAFSQNATYPEIDSLLKTASVFYKSNQDSALYYSETALKKARQINDTILLGKTIAQNGIYLISKKKYSDAEKLLRFNIQNSKKINLLDLGVTYANLGAINSLKEHRDVAIENYLSAIEIFEELDDYVYLARTYLNLGVIYENESKLEQADYFYDKSLYYSKLNKVSVTSIPHDNIKRNEGDSFEKKLKISLEALKHIENKNTSRLASVIYHDLSKNYIENKKYEEAIESAKKTIEIKNNIGYSQNIDFSYFILGKAQVRINKNDEGIENLKTAISLSEKRSLVPLMYEMIVLGYKNKGDYKNAFLYAENLSKIKDSIARYQENERIAEITSKYRVEKQANDILRLEKANQDKELLLTQQNRKRWQWASLSFIFLIVSLFLGKKLSSYINKIKKVELENKEIIKKVESKFLSLKNKTKVYLNELDYIKSDGNYIEFYCGDKKIIDRNKLKEIADELPPNFVQTHRSFIINKNAIQSVNSSTIQLKNGIEIPASRTFKQNLL